ncbi:hypothetical protein LJB86_01125 [Deltaproteobacteria bacterium OttesenSCG-928-M10]|nr:hypothetical protein [Deltaproteobacteria bacterium OttesenSCG-928-M10]
MRASSRRHFFVILALAFLLALPAGCQQEQKAAEPAAPTGEAAAPAAPPPAEAAASQGAPVPEGLALEILAFSPSGAVNKLNQVVAMFNQPMVPLGAYDQVPERALTVDVIPANGDRAYPLPGKAVWLNQYTLAFVPEKPLSGSANLSAALSPEKLAALSGARLEQGRQIAISLPPLAVVQAYENSGVAYEEIQALKPAWRISFNQAPDEAGLAAKAYFAWGGDDDRQTVPAVVAPAYPGLNDGQSSVFDFTPKEALPRNTEYELCLAEGVKSLSGPNPGPALTLAQGRTFGPLTVSLDNLNEDGRTLDPASGLSIAFANPVRLSEVLPLLNLDNGYDLEPLRRHYAQKEPAQTDESADRDGEVREEDLDDIQTYIHLGGRFKAETDYTLTVDGAAKDIYGQPLGAAFSKSFRTGQYEPEIRLDDKYGLLETATEAKLPMVVTNLAEVTIEAYAFPPAKAVEFLAAAGYDPGSYRADLEQAEDFLKRQKPAAVTLPVPAEAKNGPYIVPLDLKQIFGDRLTGHLLLVQAGWKVKDGDQTRDRRTFALIQFSDLGLAVKTGASSSLIWVTDLVRGEARPDVDLEVRDAAGRVLWSGRSDEHGLAEAPGADTLLKGRAGDDDPGLFVVARAGNQMALWGVNWNDGLETWRWNVATRDALSGQPEESSWLLNALPLYKPGETAKFKIIARQIQGDRAVAPQTEMLEVEIADGTGRVVDKSTLEVSPFGTASHELPLPPDASLGYWSVRAGRPGQEYLPQIGSFLVMAYRAPAFEIKLTGLPEKAIGGDRVEFAAKGDYHFGAPVAGQPVRYSLDSRPTWWSLPGDFADYSVINRFSQADEYDDSGYGYSEPSVTVASGETVLDPEGAVTIKVDLTPAPDQKPGPRTCGGYITVTDVDQRQVSTNAEFLVHPATLYAGLSRDNYVGETDKPFRIKLIAADLDGRLVPGREVEATLYRRVWQNVRRKSPGSVYEYVSKMKDIKVESRQVTSGEMPVELELTPGEPGYYWVMAELKDDQGRVNQAATDFYVSGHGPVGWHLTNDDRLTLVADKREYRPGETARIMVQSPFESGEGLLTVERAGVRQAYTFKIENQTPVLTVPLTEEDAPNVFVSVLLARGRIADKPDENGLDLGKPAIRLGYTELKIPTKRDLLAVAVSPSAAETRPGGEIEVAVAVSDDQGRPVSEAEVAVIAADAAVIQLAGDEAYYPEKLFHQDHPLMVLTADNLTSLVGRRDWSLKGANPGGGGADIADAAMKAGGPDSVRRNFATLAFFDPKVALDKEGRATVKIKMPENLTTFKIFAVATGRGRQTGTGQSAVLVSQDLLARSALPGYAGAGDEFEAAMVVSNRGSKAGEALVKLTGDNFTLLEDQNQKSVTVGPGESHELRFKVKAGPAEKAHFLFTVSMGDDSDSVEFAIPVSPPNQLTTQASYEQLKAGETKTDLALPEGLDLARGGLEVELSPSLVGAMSEPFDWLAAYPHGCVEQSISRGFGNLVWLDFKERLAGSEEKAEAARKNVADLLNKLRSWEYSGAYNYWPETYDWSRLSVYLTAYALDFHLSAKEAGYALPDPEIIGRLCGFLKNSLSAESRHWPSWYSARAVREAKSYVLAMLSRAGENVAAYTEVMYNQRQDLTLFELINLVRAIGFQKKGQTGHEQIRELLSLAPRHLNVTAGEIQFAEAVAPAPEIWSSSVRTTAMALTALCETTPRHDLIPGLVRWLVSASRGGHFGTTQNNAVALSALAAYVKAAEGRNPDLNIKALLGETELAAAHFQTFTDPHVKGRASLADIPHETPAVTYQVEGKGQAWAALKMKTAPAEADLSPAASGGYMLSRSFTVIHPEKGSPGTDHFKRGDVVMVTVTMVVPAPRHATVLLDRVPAGLEPINFSLGDADQSLLALAGDDEDRPGGGFWYNHQEIWPDRVAVYADYLSAGVYTFNYLARAVTVGQYLTPGPRAEEMYAPETFGRGEGQRLTVE